MGLVDELEFEFVEAGAVSGLEAEGVARGVGAGDFAETATEVGGAGDFDGDPAGLLGEVFADAGEAVAEGFAEGVEDGSGGGVGAEHVDAEGAATDVVGFERGGEGFGVVDGEGEGAFAATGLVAGIVFALVKDILFLDDVVGSDVLGFGYLGKLLMGGWRRRQRGEGPDQVGARRRSPAKQRKAILIYLRATGIHRRSK